MLHVPDSLAAPAAHALAAAALALAAAATPQPDTTTAELPEYLPWCTQDGR